MNYFVAKLVFQLQPNGAQSNQFDEQLRLIEAVNEQLALEMAYQIGLMSQEDINDKNNQKILWKFIAVTEIQHIGEISNGKEIHYKIIEPDESNEYLALVHEKANHLKTRKTIYQ
ncbi:DUF4288 domain-containing protein [Pedobacter alpinus]|uniref:DUF4288 domain-containing protein n=1 Tax=Pedobacter alpinus TaxID=1590643 RepID=A0ABW5TRG3_9SPHI